MVHKCIMTFLILLGMTITVSLGIYGYAYYRLPLIQRPHASLHALAKPSGALGHSLGIFGMTFILLLFLYSLRKRSKWLGRWGNLRHWLNYHMWMGIVGPILVTYHTAFKVGGLVSVAFWCMWAVMISGIVGRYIYVQIPRTLHGTELSARDLENMVNTLAERLVSFGLDEAAITRLHTLFAFSVAEKTGLFGLLFYFAKHDVISLIRLRKAKKALRQTTQLGRDQIRDLLKLIRQQAVLMRRVLFLERAQHLLHYWHVIHRPFAYTMVTIALIHVAVAVLFGYRWVF